MLGDCTQEEEEPERIPEELEESKFVEEQSEEQPSEQEENRMVEAVFEAARILGEPGVDTAEEDCIEAWLVVSEEPAASTALEQAEIDRNAEAVVGPEAARILGEPEVDTAEEDCSGALVVVPEEPAASTVASAEELQEPEADIGGELEASGGPEAEHILEQVGCIVVGEVSASAGVVEEVAEEQREQVDCIVAAVEHIPVEGQAAASVA